MIRSLILASLVLAQPGGPKGPDKPAAVELKPEAGWKPLGKSLWFDPKERRLVLKARIALQDGFLEHLLCREQTKEHESLLATDAEPQLIHSGLLLTGAEAGHPVRFRPRFEPPAGDPIAIELKWIAADGKERTARARDWIKDQKTGKHLETDFVFAGSDLFKDPQTGKMIYAADGGDLFTVANFTSAILDLPFASSAEDVSRSFVSDPSRAPTRGTQVFMFLRPAKKEAKKKP